MDPTKMNEYERIQHLDIDETKKLQMLVTQYQQAAIDLATVLISLDQQIYYERQQLQEDTAAARTLGLDIRGGCHIKPYLDGSTEVLSTVVKATEKLFGIDIEKLRRKANPWQAYKQSIIDLLR